MRDRITLSLRELAEVVGGAVEGDAGFTVHGIAPLDSAGEGELGFLGDRKYLPALESSSAGGFLVSEALADAVRELGRPTISVAEPHTALARALDALYPKRAPEPGVHPTAIIGKRVLLGEGVTVGPYAVIGDDVILGDHVRIGPHVCVGNGVVLGDRCVLHPQVVVYPDVRVGSDVTLHAGARVGVDGFGWVVVDGEIEAVPQVGECVLEDRVHLGANACVDRGSIGRTGVSRGAKLDNLVHIGHNVTVGANAMLAAQTGVAGSSTVGKGVVCGGQVGIAGHLAVGDGARLAAQAGVIGDIPAGETVSGYPARPHLEVLRGVAQVKKLPELAARVARLEQIVAEDASE